MLFFILSFPQLNGFQVFGLHAEAKKKWKIRANRHIMHDLNERSQNYSEVCCLQKT